MARRSKRTRREFSQGWNSSPALTPINQTAPIIEELEARCLLTIAPVYQLSAGTPSAQVANFAVPSDSSTLSFNLTTPTAGATDYLQVSLGGVILGNLSLSTASSKPAANYLTIPSSLRGTSSTLSLQLVAGEALPAAVTQVSSISTVGDLSGLNGDRKAALLTGMTAFDSVATGVRQLAVLNAPLPLASGAGVQQTANGLLNASTVLQTMFSSRVRQYFGAVANPTVDGLLAYLTSNAPAGYTVTFGSTSSDSTDSEVRVATQLTVSRTTTGLTPLLDSSASSLGVSYSGSVKVSANATLTADLAFGLSLSNGAALPNSFFLRLNNIGVSVSAGATGMNVAARIGLLNANVANGSFSLSAGINAPAASAYSGTDVTLAQLQSQGVSSLLSVSTVGSLAYNLPLTAVLGGAIPTFTAGLSSSNTGLFSGGAPTVTATGFDALAPFNNYRVNDVAGMFGKVESWLSQLKGSTLFSTGLPFVSGLTLGDGLNFAASFGSQVLAKLVDPTSGAANFASLQSMITLLGDGSTAKYDPLTSTLTFPVKFNLAHPVFLNSQPLLAGGTLNPGASLGNLANLAAIAGSLAVAPSLTGIFTLGIDLRPKGNGITISSSTPLSSLNAGQGIAPAGDPLAINVNLANGTTLTISVAGAVTLADVVADINGASPGNLIAAVDAVGKRLVLTDMTTGVSPFTVTPSGTSLAAIGLGLEGQVAARNGATNVINGEPLDGDSLANHIFVAANSSTTPASLSGTITTTATGINGTAALNFVGVGIVNGTASATASVGLTLADVAGGNGRLSVSTLLSQVASAASTATVTGKASFNLPVTVQPANLLPAVSGTPTLAVSWSKSNLTVPDGTDASGNPLPTNSASTTAFNTAAANLKSLAGLTESALLSGFQAIESYLDGPGAFPALAAALPLSKVNLGDFLGLSNQFAQFVTNLQAAAPQSLGALISDLQSSFNLAGAKVTVSWDNTPGVPAIRIGFVFNKSVSGSQSINLSMPQGNSLIDVNGSSNLSATATAASDIEFGLDLTNPALLAPFLYDSTKLSLTAALSATGISFNSNVGGAGVFVHGTSTQAAAAVFNSTGVAGAAPASYAIGFTPTATHRYYFSGNVLAGANQALIGAADAVLPIFFPTTTTPLSSPVHYHFTLSTGATTLTTPFDSGLPSVNLSSNLQSFPIAFQNGLTQLDAALTRGLSNFNIPLIGSQLTNSLSFLNQFSSAVLAKLGSSAVTLSSVSQAITAALGSGGLNWAGSSLTSGAIQPDGSAQFQLTLHRDLVSVSSQLAFNLGLPGLGLNLNNAMVAFSAGFNYSLGFGISPSGGFYLVSSPSSNTLSLTASADATSLNATGTLGFFQVNVNKPSGQAIHAGATFLINLADPSGTDNRITTSDLSNTPAANLLNIGFGSDSLGRPSGVDVNLAVSAGFATLAAPSLATGLHVEWAFGSPTGSFQIGGEPTVSFDNVSVQLGSIFQNTIGPILADVNKVISPIKPILDILTARIPVISDLLGQSVSLADLATLFGEGDITDFVYAADRVIDLANLVTSISATNSIDLGGFGFNLSTSATDLSGVSIGNIVAPPSPPISQATGSETEFFTSGSVNNAGISFPILENPSSVFNLLLGKDVDLFKFDMPKLTLGFSYTQFFPIIGPLGAEITGIVSASAQLDFGMDTYGFTHGGSLLDGFYIDDSGQPQVQLYAQLTAGAELDLGIASAGVEGGIYGNVNFTLHDPNHDGKVRFSELQDDWQLGPLYVFDVSGALKAGLDAFVEVDLLFWSQRWQFDIAQVTLVDFNLTRPSGVPFDPGEVDASGNLNLTTSNDDDHYRINPGTKPGEIVIQTHGQDYTREGVKTLNFSGGDGNDTIYVDPGVQLLPGGSMVFDGGNGDDVMTAGGATPVTMTGDAGNDQLTAGTGPAVLDGGTGNDLLVGGAGNDLLTGGPATLAPGLTDNDTIEGNSGNDLIIGGSGNDVLYGGDGNDTITGGNGNNYVSGGNGDDYVSAGSGINTLAGDAGNDTLVAVAGLDALDGGDGNDVLIGGTTLIGGDGNDTLTGSGTLPSTLVGGWGDDTIIAGSGNDSIWGDDPSGGFSGNDQISAGSGNDTIVGGGGSDSINTGNGVDVIYAGAAVPSDPNATGNDTIITGNGNDLIYGGQGNDRISTGNGNNTVYGNAGNDTILTGSGNDLISAGDGNDSVNSGLGNDVIDGGAGNDLLIGGPDTISAGQTDNDTITGGAGNDNIGGGAGNDVLAGDSGPPSDGFGGDASGPNAYGNDLISGGSGNDVIYGQGGNDTLSGNDGQDEIYGGPGDDLIYGGRDSDLLKGGDGNDTVNGGTGADVLTLDTDPSYAVTGGDVYAGYGTNGFIVNPNGATRSDIVQDDSATATDILLIAGTSGDDTITVSTDSVNPNQLDAMFNGKMYSAIWKSPTGTPLVRQIQVLGLAGNDLIDLSGLDVSGLAVAGGNQYVTGIYGGDGNDTLLGTNGPDDIYGQAGSDVIYGMAGNDRLWGDGLGGGDSSSDLNQLFGGAGNDDLIGGQGVNQLYAWSSDPTPTAAKPNFGVFNSDGSIENTGIDRMLGGPQNDSFYGAGQLAFMYGNGGSDTIYDQSGNPDTGLGNVSDEQWKQYAEQNSDVWYVPGTDGNDIIDVNNINGQITVQITTINSGGQTVTLQYTAGSSMNWSSDSTSASALRVQSVTPGTYAASSLTNPSLFNTANGWAGANGGPTSPDSYAVILVDGKGGNDTITVEPTVYTTVWLDGGAGNDTITVKANSAILPDLLEGSNDPTKLGANDIQSGASNLGAIATTTNLTGLTISRGNVVGNITADIDYYQFTLPTAPGLNDTLTVSSISPTDGMVIKLYSSLGQAVASPDLTSTNGVLSLGGLLAGNTYWVRVASDNDPSSGIGIPTSYSLLFSIAAAPTLNTINYSANHAISNLDVLLGGAGDDTLTGGLGADWILGGDGNDVLSGGPDSMAQDLIFGGAGNDKLVLSPSTLPAGTTVGTFVQGDDFDGGTGYNTVEYIGTTQPDGTLSNANPDYVAFGWNNPLGLYQLTNYVWNTASNGWLYDSNGYIVQQYQFFNAVNIYAINFNLGAGDDVFHADTAGFTMADGFSYGIAGNATAPVTSLYVNGGAGNDTIVGGAGNDWLEGDVGSDALYGGDGSDSLYAATAATPTGNSQDSDSINGGNGNDYLVGDDGPDTIVDTTGYNYVIGNAGDDKIYLEGDTQSNYVVAGDGNDSVYGGDGGENIYGGNGDDLLIGGAGNNYISGDAGNDFIELYTGDGGYNTMYGGSGNDTLNGGNGNDYLVGDTGYDLGGSDGNDAIYGGSGNDSLFGDGGSDTLYGNNGDDRINGNSGDDYLVGDNGGADASTDGNDTIFGGGGSDQIWGQGGNDYLVGDDGGSDGATDGNDTIRGGVGDDRIWGQGGNDFLFGGDGNDTINGDSGDLEANDGWDYISGDAGNDYLYGQNGRNTIYGGTGNDYIVGGNTYDVLVGDNGGADASTDGSDTLFGLGGNDSLYGQGGNDTLIGDNSNYDVAYAGDDLLAGGGGTDSMWADNGNDTVYGYDGGYDYMDGANGVNDPGYNDHAASYDGNDAKYNFESFGSPPPIDGHVTVPKTPTAPSVSTDSTLLSKPSSLGGQGDPNTASPPSDFGTPSGPLHGNPLITIVAIRGGRFEVTSSAQTGTMTEGNSSLGGQGRAPISVEAWRLMHSSDRLVSPLELPGSTVTTHSTPDGLRVVAPTPVFHDPASFSPHSGGLGRPVGPLGAFGSIPMSQIANTNTTVTDKLVSLAAVTSTLKISQFAQGAINTDTAPASNSLVRTTSVITVDWGAETPSNTQSPALDAATIDAVLGGESTNGGLFPLIGVTAFRRPGHSA